MDAASKRTPTRRNPKTVHLSATKAGALEPENVLRDGPVPTNIQPVPQGGCMWYGQQDREATADTVLRLLQSTMAVVRDPRSDNLSNIQQHILKDLDFFLPQREHAPSRSAVKSGFTKAFVTTKAGLFSVLLFRFITFRTRALTDTPPSDRKIVFGDLAEWKEYVSHLRQLHGEQAKDFFCLRAGPGRRPQPGRVIENAEDYWEVALENNWQTAFESGSLSFCECLSIIDKFRTKKRRSKRPPQFGKLSQYLTATDLVYAGAVDMPSIEDIACQIHQLDAGGLKGLRLLGYLPPITEVELETLETTVDQVTEAFTHFFEDVSVRLNSTEKTEMGWDVIMAEHSLCKISRLWQFWPNKV